MFGAGNSALHEQVNYHIKTNVGRPPKSDTKNDQITFTCTSAQRALIERAATLGGEDKSGYARRTALAAACTDLRLSPTELLAELSSTPTEALQERDPKATASTTSSKLPRAGRKKITPERGGQAP